MSEASGMSASTFGGEEGAAGLGDGTGVEGTGTVSQERVAFLDGKLGKTGTRMLSRDRDRSNAPGELADDAETSRRVSPRSSGSMATGATGGENPGGGAGTVEDAAPPGGGGGGRISS